MTASTDLESKEMEKISAGCAGQVIQTYFNLLNHIMISTVAVYMTFLCYSIGNFPITWHVWLCTIGYQLLMTQSILVFYSQNVWSKHNTRKTHKKFHWILQGLGSSAAIAGVVIEFISRWLSSKNHLISTHSIIGLIALIFTLLGMLNGISALWSVELRTYLKPVHLKLAHNLNGITAFVLGMVALYYGYDKGFMVQNARDDIRIWLQTLAITTIILSLIGALRSTLKFTRALFFK